MSRVQKHTQANAVPGEDLQMKDLKKCHADLGTVPLPTHEPNMVEAQCEEEEVKDEDIKAPLELIMKFLRAVMVRDLKLASKLCRMILIYEPDNPEASEFLPLIQKKLSQEQETGQGTEKEDADGGNEAEETSTSSGSSSDDDEPEEKQVNRHKYCPPSHIHP
ncbi:glutamate-rich protein 2 [Pseudochaenichthys georgianus]|uniref:glutamate-rich protein 2 n=1 Tax=Pseudochaenichthys georgianus TaxID=52239 RepID=UPI00146EA439|nr:glutamate-rich protein 2 [Pseudochaenichthys georgianus]